MRKRADLTGQIFGRLFVLNFSHQGKNHTAYYKCLCRCGRVGLVRVSHLNNGNVKSCGCLRKERGLYEPRHRGKRARLRGISVAMKNRCLNPKDRAFRNYGGRGIKVCERWMKFENFYEDMGPTYKEGLQIDRIDNDGNYEPKNCRWVTRKENNRNRRGNVVYKGKCLKDWAEEKGINYQTMRKRRNAGWSWEEMLNTPVKSRKRPSE